MAIVQEILVEGVDFETCEKKVRRFLTNNLLVRYDRIHIPEAEAVGAGHDSFWLRLEAGMAANRQVVDELFGELGREGCQAVDDFKRMDQGYGSKILHTIAHLLDGFFGIDSRFYNLAEDSHWLSAQLRAQITGAPAAYWLLRVRGESDGDDADQVQSLRSFLGN